jgi:hypothetical protein
MEASAIGIQSGSGADELEWSGSKVNRVCVPTLQLQSTVIINPLFKAPWPAFYRARPERLGGVSCLNFVLHLHAGITTVPVA